MHDNTAFCKNMRHNIKKNAKCFANSEKVPTFALAYGNKQT